MPRGGKREGAGRPKGRLASNTIELAEKLKALNCDPFEGMVRLAQDEGNDPQLRGRMYAELAQYVFPKRKSVELEAKVETVEHKGPDANDLAAKLERAKAGRNNG